ncbi:peptidase T [Blautia sp. HCP3S3_D9]|uniref:peptidase T n=1 Tax=Blautia sp. HCP3S3_D9 TaxID=3438912 RepID=UPI003F8BE71B
MKAYERLLSYVKVFTPSSEETGTSPSTQYQFNLARQLVQELKDLGVEDASVDDHCYVYGHIPATEGYESRKKLGFIAHMDTVSDFCDHPVTPVVTPNYDGGELTLGTSGRVLSPKMFPHLSSLKGRTLITSDGTTILGADDKAGVAEIMTMIEHLNNGTIAHGPISVAFTPDEEIGGGTDYFDVKKFNADYAYTLDGDTEGEIQYENFNAGRAVVEFTGVNVHPGSSKNTMVNAALVAMEFNSMLPSADTPRDTEEYEGFFHLDAMNGNVSTAMLDYIIRDHDAASFDCRIKTMEHITKILNEKWGKDTVKLTITEQYRNMKEVIDTCMELINCATAACKEYGTPALITPIRGGTDGARLSFMGVPCPNLGTGGHAFHGPYEHITVEGMDIAVEVGLKIIELFYK